MPRRCGSWLYHAVRHAELWLLAADAYREHALTSMIFCPRFWAMSMNCGFWNILAIASCAAAGSSWDGSGGAALAAAPPWPHLPGI